jgi:hypothetical protein
MIVVTAVLHQLICFLAILRFGQKRGAPALINFAGPLQSFDYFSAPDFKPVTTFGWCRFTFRKKNQ